MSDALRGGLPWWLMGKGTRLPVQETQETWVRSLDQEEPLEEGMATHSSILAWRIPMDRGAWRATVHGVAESRTRLRRPGTHTGGWWQLCDSRGQNSKRAGPLSTVADLREAPCSLLVFFSTCLIPENARCSVFKFIILLFCSGQCPLLRIIFTLGVISLLETQSGSSPEPQASLPWADAGPPASTNAPLSSHSPHRSQRSFLFF